MGELITLVFGANDILGDTPRCLTVDGNGRLMTYPYEHPNSWTNTYLEDIRDQTNHNRQTEVSLLASITLGSSVGSTAIDLDTKQNLNLYGSNTGGNSFWIEVSNDNTNFYKWKIGSTYEIYPDSNGFTFGIQLSNVPRYVRIKANSSDTFIVKYNLY